MAQLTWKEVKEVIESQNVKDDTLIDFIDISGFEFIKCFLKYYENKPNVYYAEITAV